MAFLFYFQAMNSISLNGRIIEGNLPVLTLDNRAFRYGDGLFETMKVVQGRIALAPYHFDRLWNGLNLLSFQIPAHFDPNHLAEQILKLCIRNKCESLARVRLTVFRGNGGIFESLDQLQYSIECWPLNETSQRLNENGLVIDLCPDVRKCCDRFANLKSASYQAYALAALHAKRNRLNEALVLNQHERVADGTIANLFLVMGDRLITPPLTEGPVDGVMRRFIATNAARLGYGFEETPVTVSDIEEADELFLTNAITAIRWVRNFRNKTYGRSITSSIYERLAQTITA